MGHVHEEQRSQNRGYHEWESLTLGEPETIKELIINRSLLDSMVNIRNLQGNSIETAENKPFIELVEVLYLDLDNLIEQCKFNKEQLFIIKKLEEGYGYNKSGKYDFTWLRDKLGKKYNKEIDSLFKNICKRISEKNLYNWKETLETSGLVKTKDKFKQCTICKSFKRMNPKEFHKEPKGKDGFKNTCKECVKNI